MPIPQSEIVERTGKVRKKMEEEGFDALLVYSYKSNAIRYLTNYSPRYSVTNSALLVLPISGDPVIFTRLPGHLEEAKRASYIKDIRVSVSTGMNVASMDQMASDCKEVLEGHAGDEGKIGLVGYAPEMGIALPLRNAMPKAEFAEANFILDELRMIKSTNELTVIGKAAKIADKAFNAALDAMRDRKIDHEVFAASEFCMRRNGALGTQTFFGICKRDKVYLQPTGEKVRDGFVYFLETIPEYEGYWPERVANVAVGDIPDKWEKIFKITERLLEQTMKVLKPGISIAELVKAICKFTRDAGLDGVEYRLGHGVGLDNIEQPEYLSSSDQTVIKPGMVLAIHPNVSIPDVCSTHLGGTFEITDSGARPLTSLKTRMPHV